MEQIAVKKPPKPSPLGSVKQAVRELSIEDFEEFKQWFRGYCGLGRMS